MPELQFLSMNNIKIRVQSISPYYFFCCSCTDLQECEQSMEKMAERGRRRKDDEETEELDPVSLTPNSHLLLAKATGDNALSKFLFY